MTKYIPAAFAAFVLLFVGVANAADLPIPGTPAAREVAPTVVAQASRPAAPTPPVLAAATSSAVPATVVDVPAAEPPAALPPLASPPTPVHFAQSVLPPVADPDNQCEVQQGQAAATSDDLMTFTLPLLEDGGTYSGPANVTIFTREDESIRNFDSVSKVQWCAENSRIILDVEVIDGVIIVPLARSTGFIDLAFLVGGSVINVVVPGDIRAKALRSN